MKYSNRQIKYTGK